MSNATNPFQLIVFIAAVAATAIMVWYGTGLEPIWPLVWLAPVPILLLALRSSTYQAAIAAFLSWLLGSLNSWDYFKLLRMPFIARASIVSSEALLSLVAVLLFRSLVRRGSAWSALLAFPAFWVSCDYLRSTFTADGTAGSLAYTQLKFLPFLQLASITGPWGLTFVLLLFPAALAIVVYQRATAPRQTLLISCVVLASIGVVLVFGEVRLHTQPASRAKARVGLIASDTPANSGVAPQGEKTARLLRDYAAEAVRLAAQGAQMIVLPEHLGVIADSDTANADAQFQSIADGSRSTIVVGLSYVSSGLTYNQARVYRPQAPIETYSKQHLLVPVESGFTPGTELTVLPGSPSPIGIAICKDMDFRGPGNRYGAAGVGLMLVPAWDFDIDRAWHGHIAIMRGVENGYSIARAARNGNLTVSDDRGRILAETQSDSAPFATLMATVPTSHDFTLYLLLGDWFAWLSLAVLVFVFVQRFRARAASQE